MAKQLRQKVAEQPLPPGYSLIYMVLAIQFESFKHPFTIMVSLPLALVGALLGQVLLGFNVSMGAMIGIARGRHGGTGADEGRAAPPAPHPHDERRHGDWHLRPHRVSPGTRR